MLEAAVGEAVAAIEQDGAEVLILGCSAAYWLQPLLQARLADIGWEVPVLEGYRCAIVPEKFAYGIATPDTIACAAAMLAGVAWLKSANAADARALRVQPRH